MQQTRRLDIEQKIISLVDLRRIADIVEKQKQLAVKSGHSHSVKYAINFDDRTSIGSDIASILLDSNVTDTRRPVSVNIDFHNFTLKRSIVFRVIHGPARYGNEVEVSGTEGAWVNDVFLRLQEAIAAVKPQGNWISNHPTLLLNFLAVGIGCLIMLVIHIVVGFFYILIGSPTSLDSSNSFVSLLIIPIVEFLREHKAIGYALDWLNAWVLGLIFGAAGLRDWLLRAWPNIELDFGAEHLRREMGIRRRITAGFTLVVLPIIISFVLDVLDWTRNSHFYATPL